MKSMVKYLFVLLMLVAWTGAVNAELVDNGSTTIDTDTGLEWLDLSETTGLSYNEVLASTFVVTDGYRFATEAELMELYSNAGGVGTTSASTSVENKAPAILLLNLMGCTSYLVSSPCDGVPEEWSPGMWGSSSQYIGLIDDRFADSGILATRWVTYGNDDVSFRVDVAAFLVRDAVGQYESRPVPSMTTLGLGLMMLAFLLLASRRLGVSFKLK